MGDLVDSVVRLFELLVEGALGLGVAIYIIAFQHRWKRHLTDYFHSTMQFVTGQMVVQSGAVRAGLLIGAVYYVGILTNLGSFAVLRPAHERIVKDISELSRAGQVNSGIVVPKEASIPELMVLPLWGAWTTAKQTLRGRGVGSDTVYAWYIREETEWRNRKADVAGDVLGSILKQVRVARGTAACAVLIAGLALLKALFYGTVRLLSGQLPGRQLAWIDERFVRMDLPEEMHPGLELEARNRNVVCIELKELMWASVVYCMVAIMVYTGAMTAYKVGEREYHLMAHYGAVGAGQLK